MHGHLNVKLVKRLSNTTDFIFRLRFVTSCLPQIDLADFCGCQLQLHYRILWTHIGRCPSSGFGYTNNFCLDVLDGVSILSALRLHLVFSTE